MTLKQEVPAIAHDYPPIGEHAIVGDTRTAALITRDGSIDWLCLPRFDSPSILGSLLDRRRGGSWSLRPIGAAHTEWHYEDETNVLVTRHRSAAGEVSVRDAMTLGLPDERGARLHPEHELLRIVEGVAGEVELESIFEPRPGYALERAQLVDRRGLGIRLEASGQSVTLLSEAAHAIDADGRAARARFSVRRGERVRLTLVSDRTAPAVLPALGDAADERMARTERWWREWSAKTTYAGAYRAAVVRSALLLKLLVYSPSGAIVAAPTTSLPERRGGSKNWDYRYCWLRDAAFTIRALYELGHATEADSFLAWLLHATRVSLPRLAVMYDVFGTSQLPERELSLEGYAGARPVRVGNAAASQSQLDVYGEVIDAALRHAALGGTIDAEQAGMLAQLGETVCRTWQEPDNGIWERRGEQRHYTQSKMLAWVALDRLLQLEARGAAQIDHHRVVDNRHMLAETIERESFDERRQSYVEASGRAELDAAVLSGFLHGYADWQSPRVRGTLAALDAELGSGALLHRHHDANDPDGGAFGAASFWMVDCLARAGRQDEARGRFEELLDYANELGLYAEMIEPGTGAALGNFPQGLTHVALINAARTLEDVAQEA